MRPIDADALKAKFCNHCDERDCKPDATDTVYGCVIADTIDSMPTIEAEPVVRCKDCKYRQDDDFCGGRGWPAQLVPDDGYCDRGARMDGDKDNNVRNLTDEETAIYESWIESEAKDTDLNIMGGDSDA